LKVSLNLPPEWPVWRRLLIPAEFRLNQLHDILQAAFGWLNSHLHEFRIGERTFGRPDWQDHFEGEPQPEDEPRVRLQSVFSETGSKAMYVYDFGDNWEHEILFEGQQPREAGKLYPFCADGLGQCPPEDCGGAQEYEHFVRVMQDRFHPEYRELRRWLGRDFDPDEFSLDRVNRNLRASTRRKSQLPIQEKPLG